MTKRKIKSTWGDYLYNGIDRFDNNIHYILSNCVPCCKICNRMKHTMTAQEWLDHLDRITKQRTTLNERIETFKKMLTKNERIAV